VLSRSIGRAQTAERRLTVFGRLARRVCGRMDSQQRGHRRADVTGAVV